MANTTTETKKRPRIVTILCIINGLWAIKLLPSIANPALKQYGDVFPPLYGIIVALIFISVIGVWHMRKWGVNMYIISFFMKELFLMQIDDISKIGIAVSSVSIMIFLIYYKQMNQEL